MSWTLVIIPVAIVAGLFLIKRMAFVSEAAARRHLDAGALVIDVRSAGEFRGDRVPGAINIPLGELREALPRRVPDKGRVLLLHCLSGGRSGIAQRQVKGMGYTNAFNLGSLGRAKRIAGGSRNR